MTNNLTPADIEYVPVTSIEIGDVLVSSFHSLRQQGDEVPTARQLSSRARFTTVDTIDRAHTARGREVIEFNINALVGRITCVPTISVWRVKR